MNDPLFCARSLSFSVQGKPLLSNFDLDVQPGELVAILGRNGTGKSTFLNLATGELLASSGSIELFSAPLESHKVKALAGRRAVLAQTTALAFDYSVLEVVLLGRLPHQHASSADKDHEIAMACLAKVEMANAKDRGYLSLSGGEQQRVHFARVMAQIYEADRPRLLFLDEPTNNLDLRHQHQTLQWVKEFTSSGSAAVAVLHDLNLAAQYADRIVILKDGSILANGEPNSVLTQDIIQAAYDVHVTVSRHPHKSCPLIA
ncbi:heme ABC transporter ATP-binding protein [Comamonas testosteroni]|uniref:heme ABC transporter ATP-binding protein n=1 Tax=Comamonas testosteroni TaxID=285 RepID=UPI00389A7658